MTTIPIGQIKGFLVAEYSDPATNRHTFANVEDFDKIRLGYACAVCLAEFTCYMPRCPLCGNERDVWSDIRETPPDIQAYYDEATGPSTGRTEARPMHEVIEELAASDDVEHVRLGKRSRWGR